MTKVRVKAVQAEPGWNDLQASVAKTIKLIKEAGEKGINVLGFPEVWIPGYLWSLWTSSPINNVELFHQYMANSLARNSPEMDAIKAAVKEAGIFTSFISPEGEIVHHRRKLKPTHVEWSLWGNAQADSVQTVVDSPFGKIGALNCWEHLQPLLRYYEYKQGVQIHVASWPPMFPLAKGVPGTGIRACLYADSHQGQPSQAEFGRGGDDSGARRGFSMIFGPDGTPLVEAPPAGVECILQADIDLQSIGYAKAMADPNAGRNDTGRALSILHGRDRFIFNLLHKIRVFVFFKIITS
ncbi:hypothetical protein VTN00DRAFT_2091 [Thermoascus crustaceus]|uniref:uncharacterized protein n=1 Tax=Thermoascus crustaceus TaxID=5088 RepID=UPI003743A985